MFAPSAVYIVEASGLVISGIDVTGKKKKSDTYVTFTKWVGLSNRQPADRRIRRQAARQEDWRQGRDTGGHRASYKVNKLTFYFPAEVTTETYQPLSAVTLTCNRFKVMVSGL